MFISLIQISKSWDANSRLVFGVRWLNYTSLTNSLRAGLELNRLPSSCFETESGFSDCVHPDFMDAEDGGGKNLWIQGLSCPQASLCPDTPQKILMIVHCAGTATSSFRSKSPRPCSWDRSRQLTVSARIILPSQGSIELAMSGMIDLFQKKIRGLVKVWVLCMDGCHKSSSRIWMKEETDDHVLPFSLDWWQVDVTRAICRAGAAEIHLQRLCFELVSSEELPVLELDFLGGFLRRSQDISSHLISSIGQD